MKAQAQQEAHDTHINTETIEEQEKEEGGSQPVRSRTNGANPNTRAIRICGAKTARGTPCGSPAVVGKDRCWQHEPGYDRGKNKATLWKLIRDLHKKVDKLLERPPHSQPTSEPESADYDDDTDLSATEAASPTVPEGGDQFFLDEQPGDTGPRPTNYAKTPEGRKDPKASRRRHSPTRGKPGESLGV